VVNFGTCRGIYKKMKLSELRNQIDFFLKFRPDCEVCLLDENRRLPEIIELEAWVVNGKQKAVLKTSETK